MRSLVLVFAVRAHQHAGHHGQRTKGGGHHIAHHIAVVVLAGPDKAALAANDAGNDIVNEAVEVGNAGSLKFCLVFGVVHLLEDILEGVVILLGNGVLGAKPQILLHVQCVVEAAAGKAADGIVLVVLALQHTGTFKIEHGGTLLGAVGTGEQQLCLTGTGDAELRALVHVAIGMAGDGDGLFPVLDHRLDAVDHDGGTEHGAVQHGADGTVGALPHLVQLVLVHALGIGGDGGALDRHAILLVGKSSVHGHLVAGGIAVGQAKVIVFGLEVHKRKDQFVLDHLPQDAGHLVAVHLDEGRGHFDLFHSRVPFPL